MLFRSTPCPIPSLGYVRAALAAVGRAGTQAAEARASGVARVTWCRWERGVGRGSCPPRDAVEAIAARWGVSVLELQAEPAPVAHPRLETALRAARAEAGVVALVEEHGRDVVRTAANRVLRVRGVRSS